MWVSVYEYGGGKFTKKKLESYHNGNQGYFNVFRKEKKSTWYKAGIA